MKFKTKSAVLAAGFTAAIITFVRKLIYITMFWGYKMPVGKMAKKGMMYKGWKCPFRPDWCSMPAWKLLVKPLIAFVVAAAAAWLFVYFFRMFEKK
jgi:hypothetical protein